MTREDPSPLSLPERPSIEKLKKDAKQLLREYRAGDSDAVGRVSRFHPRPTEFSGLRDAQLALARQYGYPDWDQLSTAAELKLLRSRSLTEQADLFAADASVRYSGDDRAFRYRRAAAMLEQEPGLARVNLYSALAAGNLKAVEEKLNKDRSGINAPGGPLGRPPLLYLTYSRVPADREEVLGILRLLLDAGADPDSHVMLDDGTTRFSAMTGAMGEGERGPVSCPPHPYAEDLVIRLLEAGADPNEAQGLYNTQFTESIDKWLPLLLRYGLKADHGGFGDGESTLDYFVSQAAASGQFGRVRLLVEHGANPNAVNRYNRQSCYSLALLRGHEEMAEWLVSQGATARPIGTDERFLIACRKGDRQRLAELLDQHPGLSAKPQLLRVAAHFGIDLVLWLVEHGFDIDGQTPDGRTLLMDYAQRDDVESVRTLLEHGADPEIYERHWHATALGFALHNRNWKVSDYLVETSQNILDVCRYPHVERARFLLDRDPSIVSERTPMANTALHLVSQARDLDIDPEASAAVVDLLLEHGADLEARNREGLTPLQSFRKLGVDDMVELLLERGARMC
jgi:ankyrin repeat protein